MKVYGDTKSGNCLKVKYTADKLKLPYDWIDVDIMAGASHGADFLAINPAGQVPALRLDDGRTLAQSNAIISFLAEGSALIPTDPFARAKVMEWLFWEQYSHEPAIAVCRFHMAYLGRSASERDADKVDRGLKALERMEAHLAEQDYFVGDGLTIADIALVAYTRVADEGGFDLTPYPALRNWIARIEADLALS